MAFQDNREKVLRAAGAASAAAPYVRRIVTDAELRKDLRALVVAARHLIEGLTESGPAKLLDDDVRKDLDRIVASLQGAGDRVVHVRRRSDWAWWATGGAFIGGAVAGLLIYPATRRRLLRAVGVSQGDSWVDAASGNGSGAEDRARTQMAA
jgi:hypothetical protein